MCTINGMTYIYIYISPTLSDTWNQQPAEALGTFPCNPEIFRNTVRKAIINGVK